MKRIFATLSLLICQPLFGQASGQNTPCYWSGTVTKCFPSTGIELDNNKVARFDELTSNGVNYVEVKAPASLASDFTLTLPAQTGTVAVNPMTTAGDTIYGGVSGVETRLPAGTSVQVLHGGSTPSWGAVSLTADVTGVLPLANGGTNKNMTAVAGGVIWSDADSQEVSAAGTSGQYLKSNGTSAPSYSAVDLASSSVTGILPLANGGTNKNATAVNGGLVYSDADSLEITSAGTAQQWVLSGGAGAPTMSNTTTTAKTIDGSADAVQLLLQGHSTQTSNIFEVETSAASNLFTVSNAGVATITGTSSAVNLDVTGRLQVLSVPTGTIGLIQQQNSTSGGVTVFSVEDADTTADSNEILLFGRFTGDDDATGAFFASFRDSGGQIGSITAASATTVAFNTSSDARLKKNVAPIRNGLETVEKIGWSEFDWIEDGHHDFGVIAQDLKKVYPYVVSGDEKGDVRDAPMQVDYGRLTPILGAAIKDLAIENRALNYKVSSLEKSIEQLQKRLNAAGL